VAHQPERIIVEVQPDTAPIVGHVRANAQGRRPFTGWTGLFAALRRAVAESTGSHPPPAGPAGGDRDDAAATERKDP
jgi:hypothetical protein